MYRELKDCLERLNQKETFKPGDIVQWKSGLKNKRSDGPFIVVNILAEPITDATDESGSPYFREPLDIVLGQVDQDGDFISYYYDSRRFTKVE